MAEIKIIQLLIELRYCFGLEDNITTYFRKIN
jgi:hypothetical protein